MLLDAAQVGLWITLIGAIVAGALKIINALKEIIGALKDNKQIALDGQADSKKRSDAIHTLVNSNTDKLKETIAQLEATNAELTATIAGLHRGAELPPAA